MFLRGGLAVTAASVSAGLSGVRPADAETKGGAKPHSPERIRQVYARETRQAGGTWCSLVTMTAAGGGQTTVIDERADTEVRAASVNKLAMAVALMDKIDRRELRMDQKVELTADAIVAGAGDSGMWHLQKTYGDALTLANVITTLLLLSEDSALPLIARVLPADELNGILQRKGFQKTRVAPDTEHPGRFNHGSTTPREMHTLLTGLAQKTIVSPESADFLLEIMRWSEPGYTDGVRRNMSSQERARVAAKYGAYNDRRHEVGIVFDSAGAPALTFAFFAVGLDDQDDYGATHPAVEARAVLGRTLLDAVGGRS
ncbi:serine hydrolase [Actinoallomurus acanthiterrae]